MLIKHNLWTQKPYWKQDKINNNYNSLKIKIDQRNLVEGKNYIFSGFTKQTSNGTGRFSIGIGDEKDVGWYMFPSTTNAGEFIYKFKYVKNKMAYFYVYTNVYEACANIGIELFNPKIYEENNMSEVYLPNINNLTVVNKPLLPPEGKYKEIKPM